MESSSPELWKDHLQTNHECLIPLSQLQAVAATAKKRKDSSVEQEGCPLCLACPGASRRKFTTHVGRHMEEIALMALPRETDEGSDSSSSLGDGRSFNRRDNLEDHVRRIHPGPSHHAWRRSGVEKKRGPSMVKSVYPHAANAEDFEPSVKSNYEVLREKEIERTGTFPEVAEYGTNSRGPSEQVPTTQDANDSLDRPMEYTQSETRDSAGKPSGQGQIKRVVQERHYEYGLNHESRLQYIKKVSRDASRRGGTKTNPSHDGASEDTSRTPIPPTMDGH